MPVLPIAVRLESLGLPLRKAIPAAAEMGARGVQFDAVGELAPEQLSETGKRQLRHLISSHGLNLVAVGFPTRRAYDHLDRLEARIAQTKKVLAFSHEMGAEYTLNRLGVIPEERTPKNEHFFDAIQQIAAEAERVGSRFAIRTGDNSPERLAAFLDEMGLYGLGVAYDPANLLARDHDIYEGVYQLYKWIVGTLIKDVVQSGTSISGFTEVAIGKGEIDWELLLGRLESVEYRGYLTLEREQPSPRNHAEIAEAVSFLHAMNE